MKNTKYRCDVRNCYTLSYNSNILLLSSFGSYLIKSGTAVTLNYLHSLTSNIKRVSVCLLTLSPVAPNIFTSIQLAHKVHLEQSRPLKKFDFLDDIGFLRLKQLTSPSSPSTAMVNP